MSKIVANMVGRNEASRFLEPVLQHLSLLVDEICFTDDCSDDETFEVASKYADSIRLDEPTFVKNEGLLRQKSWEHLSKHAKPGDWILAIDCDEKLWNTDRMRSLMENPDTDVLGITFVHMWNETHYRIDKAWRPNVSSRMFRYYEGGQFAQRTLACGSEPEYVQRLIRDRRANWNTGLVMQHLGYTRDEDKQAKYDRYMTLDKGDFHSLTHIQSIIDPDPLLVEFEYGK